jgi:hypothetical protein
MHISLRNKKKLQAEKENTERVLFDLSILACNNLKLFCVNLYYRSAYSEFRIS